MLYSKIYCKQGAAHSGINGFQWDSVLPSPYLSQRQNAMNGLEPQSNLFDPKKLNAQSTSSCLLQRGPTLRRRHFVFSHNPSGFRAVKSLPRGIWEHLCQQHLLPRSLTAVYTASSKNWKGWARMSTQRRNFWLQAAFHLEEEEGRQKQSTRAHTQSKQACCLSKLSWQASHSLKSNQRAIINMHPL